jgi:hypothetical protein
MQEVQVGEIFNCGPERVPGWLSILLSFEHTLRDPIISQDCFSGQYSKDDKECAPCEFGRYAPQPLTGSCLQCSAGSHTNNVTASTTCTPCDAGTYSLGAVFECSRCQVGKFSPSGQKLCLLWYGSLYLPWPSALVHRVYVPRQ